MIKHFATTTQWTTLNMFQNNLRQNRAHCIWFGDFDSADIVAAADANTRVNEAKVRSAKLEDEKLAAIVGLTDCIGVAIAKTDLDSWSSYRDVVVAHFNGAYDMTTRMHGAQLRVRLEQS